MAFDRFIFRWAIASIFNWGDADNNRATLPYSHLLITDALTLYSRIVNRMWGLGSRGQCLGIVGKRNTINKTGQTTGKQVWVTPIR